MKISEQTVYFRQRMGELKRIKPVRVGAFFIGAGAILFHFVWWPIQAERARTRLLALHDELAEKKAELNLLHSHYQIMTALPLLDQWAKHHGPWTVPTQDDIITLSN